MGYGGRSVISNQGHLPGHALSGRLVVASNHDHPYTGQSTPLHGMLDLYTRWILHTNQSYEAKIPLVVLAHLLPVPVWPFLVGQCQTSQPLVTPEALSMCAEFVKHRSIYGNLQTVGQHHGRAARKNILRGALGVEAEVACLRVLAQRAHLFPPPIKLEREHLPQLLLPCVIAIGRPFLRRQLSKRGGHRRVPWQSDLLGKHPQRNLRGLSCALVRVLLWQIDEMRVIAKRATGAKLKQGLGVPRMIHPLSVPHYVPCWCKRRSSHVILDKSTLPARSARPGRLPSSGPCQAADDVDNAHLVRGERPRLVGAYHRCATQCFNRLQFSHDGVLLRHLPRPQRQARRHNSGQSLWNRRDRQGNRNLEVVQRPSEERPVQRIGEVGHVDHPHKNTDKRDRLGQKLAKLIQLDLQRCVLLGGRRHCRANLSQRRRLARTHDHTPRPPRRHDSPGEDHVHLILIHRLGHAHEPRRLRHTLALPRQNTLIHPKVRRKQLQHPNVCRHL
mmetsp:Transcript_6393/g.17699  ORF Transcript_6393/g.17699 Transcript_6393/m.17699 type:complete len:502 (-) Transcript_6393:487-1992(-)